jgi:hypothetical protein
MDIHYQPIAPDQVHGIKVFTFGYKTARKVEGLQALVNRWVRVLMTPKSSDPMEPELGTEFADLIGTNIPKSAQTNVIDIVAMAVDDATEQVQEQDRVGRYGASESLDAATIQRFIPTTAGDGFELWVLIKNKAGENLTVRLSDYSDR